MMTQQEYEAAISKVREILIGSIEAFEIAFEEMKDVIYKEKKINVLNSFLHLLLLVAHTEQGRTLFLKALTFSSKIDTEIANKFWNEFDDIENLVAKRYFNITIKQPCS